jgi:hypothetical protein
VSFQANIERLSYGAGCAVGFSIETVPSNISPDREPTRAEAAKIIGEAGVEG